MRSTIASIILRRPGRRDGEKDENEIGLKVLINGTIRNYHNTVNQLFKYKIKKDKKGNLSYS